MMIVVSKNCAVWLPIVVSALMIPLLLAYTPPEEVTGVQGAGMFFFILILLTFFLLLLKKLVKYVKVVSESVLFLLYSLLSRMDLLVSSVFLLFRLITGSRYMEYVTLLLSVAVASFIIGTYFSFEALLLLYVLLIVYDAVSVYVTGHMKKLAKTLVNSSKKGDKVAIGTGDLAVPLAFSVSLFYINPLYFVISVVGATIGLLNALNVLDKYGEALPALPFIGGTQLLLTGLSLFLLSVLHP